MDRKALPFGPFMLVGSVLGIVCRRLPDASLDSHPVTDGDLNPTVSAA